MTQAAVAFDPGAATPAPFPQSCLEAVNVASVPQRSPLRYPGGKTWLIPHVRHWLRTLHPPIGVFIEPFAGGGIVSLTAIMEGFAKRGLLCELDDDVAAFWGAALHHGPALRRKIETFFPTPEAVLSLAAEQPSSTLERGFRTLVLNRTRRGGILAPGASLQVKGENGKGVASRWYAKTLTMRIRAIELCSERFSFHHSDGVSKLERWLAIEDEAAVFVDPPYTAGGKRAGSRLYVHAELDHAKVFELLADSNVPFLMTYDCAPEIAALVRRFGFSAVQVTMKNTHHSRIAELVITRRPVFHA